MFHLLLLPLLYALRPSMLDYAEDRLATCQLKLMPPKSRLNIWNTYRR